MNCNPQDRPVNAATGQQSRAVPSRHRSCAKCTFQLNTDCLFCPNCGTKVEEQKQQPEVQKPDPTVFCSSCGSRYSVCNMFIILYPIFTF